MLKIEHIIQRLHITSLLWLPGHAGMGSVSCHKVHTSDTTGANPCPMKVSSQLRRKLCIKFWRLSNNSTAKVILKCENVYIQKIKGLHLYIFI